MKNYNEMANDVLRRIGEHEIEQRNRRRTVSRVVAPLFCLCLIALIGLGMQPNEIITNPDETLPITENTDQTISLEGFKPSGNIFAMYDNGYTSIEELLNVTTLIVRATPIAVESESEVAICWVLRIEDSNIEGLETIRLRPLKDEYLLKIDQEVVLALQEDSGEGYYHIPGGGSGLFRMNEADGTVNGVLLDSLKNQLSATNSTALTLRDIFDILTELEQK